MPDIPDQLGPAGTRVAIVENGAVQELHLERALERGLVATSTSAIGARAAGHAVAFIDIGLDRAAFLHWPTCTWRHPAAGDNAAGADRAAQVFEGQTLMVQVIRTPSAPRARGCRRRISSPAAAGVPAAGQPHRHLAEDRLAELREQLRCAHARLPPPPTARHRRLHPAHQRRGRHRRRTRRRHRLPAQDLGRWSRAREPPAGRCCTRT